MIFLYNKHKENKMTTKQIKTIKIKTFKVIHFSMKVFILQHNCIKRTTTKCPKGEGKSDIGSYFLIMEINTSLIQFSSVAQSCLTLCDPMDSRTPNSPNSLSRTFQYTYWLEQKVMGTLLISLKEEDFCYCPFTAVEEEAFFLEHSHFPSPER